MRELCSTARVRGVAALVSLALLLSGCAGVKAPAYDQNELQQQCQRSGGWWHPDDLVGGSCEYMSPGMV